MKSQYSILIWSIYNLVYYFCLNIYYLILNRFYPWALTMVFQPNASAHFLPSNKVESIPSIESPAQT